MEIDPKRARTSLARRVPSRLKRLAEADQRHAAAHPVIHKGGRSPKAIGRLLKKLRRVDATPYSDAWVRDGTPYFATLDRFVSRMSRAEDGRAWGEEAVTYILEVMRVPRRSQTERRRFAVNVTDHAIERWAARSEHRLAAPDRELLGALDAEAASLASELMNARRGEKMTCFAHVAFNGDGIWVLRAIKHAKSGNTGLLCRTFLGLDDLSDRQLLWLDTACADGVDAAYAAVPDVVTAEEVTEEDLEECKRLLDELAKKEGRL